MHQYCWKYWNKKIYGRSKHLYISDFGGSSVKHILVFEAQMLRPNELLTTEILSSGCFDSDFIYRKL